MHSSLEQLMAGDGDIVHHYMKAAEEWRRFFSEFEAQPVLAWAKWLHGKQIVFFEKQCGGRWLGQEVMGWSGFAALYSTQSGFENNLPLARKLAEAFEKSMCSMEVKGHARRAAASYSVQG